MGYSAMRHVLCMIRDGFGDTRINKGDASQRQDWKTLASGKKILKAQGTCRTY